MSYAHYWTRALELERDSFMKASEDIRLIISRAQDMGLQLAGPSGSGKPIVNEATIAFNGSAFCGHRYRDLGKPFASKTAHGVEAVDPPYDPHEQWYSGPCLETRICGGTCAGEPFVVDRMYLVRDWERPEEGDIYACSCETHFKPYDLIVTAAMIRLKERLGASFTVSSENPEGGFEDGFRLCRELFGWPTRFEIKKSEAEVVI